ncbi:MAG: site-specific DNA-methyltransferase [Ignavibacteria bacterium]|nr:site-specific DNA-methyltransferase [Ignavibacteria bacterium]
MSKTATAARPKRAKASSLDPLIERLNSFSADNYWDLGKFLVERVIPAALNEGIFGDQVLKRMADVPGFKFPYAMLKQCMKFFTYYPDVQKRKLPEIFYFELATKVDDSRKRDQYERLALKEKMTISEFQKKIREDELARREDNRTQFGFDLKERNVWSFDTPDPRFGRSGYKGRLPGQVIANALYYYTSPGSVVVDPMAGSGTTGDILEALPYFGDRKVRMYDLNPSDSRIERANILLTGIPEQSGSVDYLFLDPPSEFYPGGEDADFSPELARSETMMSMKSLMRESNRILKSGGRVSILVECTTGTYGTIDFPYEVNALARELGLKQIGKVYLPRRSDSSRKIVTGGEGLRPMASDCREMLTFEKP